MANFAKHFVSGMAFAAIALIFASSFLSAF